MMARKSHRQFRRNVGRLRFEPLEERTLLAIAAFAVNLYEDAGGVPGELVTDDTVQVGDTFFVEITAREHHPLTEGLRGVALDLAWNPQVLREVTPDFNPSDPQSPLVTHHFPLFRQGHLDNQAGTIENLSGFAALSSNAGRAIGNLVPERFSLLRFEALEPAESSPFSMKTGQSRIVTVPTATLGREYLDFEFQTITIVAREDTPAVEQETTAQIASEPLLATPAEPIVTTAPTGGTLDVGFPTDFSPMTQVDEPIMPPPSDHGVLRGELTEKVTDDVEDVWETPEDAATQDLVQVGEHAVFDTSVGAPTWASEDTGDNATPMMLLAQYVALPYPFARLGPERVPWLGLAEAMREQVALAPVLNSSSGAIAPASSAAATDAVFAHGPWFPNRSDELRKWDELEQVIDTLAGACRLVPPISG